MPALLPHTVKFEDVQCKHSRHAGLACKTVLLLPILRYWFDLITDLHYVGRRRFALILQINVAGFILYAHRSPLQKSQPTLRRHHHHLRDGALAWMALVGLILGAFTYRS
jgi:hypothetical protein